MSGPRVLMVDNYDSFTFNLVQYLGELGAEVSVHRNDQIDVAGIRAARKAKAKATAKVKAGPRAAARARRPARGGRP